jgi:hypothetical protein
MINAPVQGNPVDGVDMGVEVEAAGAGTVAVETEAGVG